MSKLFDVKDYLVGLEEFWPKPQIPVCLPGGKTFMIEKESARHCYLIREDNQWHLLHPDVAKLPGIKNVQKATLYKGVFEDGSLYLHPVTHPEPGKISSWFDSWQEIIEEAETRWQRSRKVEDEKRFDARIVKGLTPPDWPEWTMEQCIAMAFDKKHIDSPDHPLVVVSKKSASRSVIEDEFED